MPNDLDHSTDDTPEAAAGQDGYSRRRFLGVGTAALAAAALTAGRVRAQMPDDTARAEQDRSNTDAGPENLPVAAEHPDASPSPRPLRASTCA